MRKAVVYNLITYAVCLIIAIAGILYGSELIKTHSSIRLWDYTNVLLLLIAVPFLFWQTRTGLPEFWEEKISNKKRLLFPLLIGIIFGILDVLVLEVLLPHPPYKELPPFTQPFPYSLLLYFSGGVEVEVFYRLIPLTLFLLIGNTFRQGKYYSAFFWVAAVLTSLREPLEQMPGGGLLLIVYSLVTGFGMNFLQAIWYRKAGFLASLFIRLGHYLIWHILLGIYIQFVQLHQL